MLAEWPSRGPAAPVPPVDAVGLCAPRVVVMHMESARLDRMERSDLGDEPSSSDLVTLLNQRSPFLQQLGVLAGQGVEHALPALQPHGRISSRFERLQRRPRRVLPRDPSTAGRARRVTLGGVEPSVTLLAVVRDRYVIPVGPSIAVFYQGRTVSVRGRSKGRQGGREMLGMNVRQQTVPAASRSVRSFPRCSLQDVRCLRH